MHPIPNMPTTDPLTDFPHIQYGFQAPHGPLNHSNLTLTRRHLLAVESLNGLFYATHLLIIRAHSTMRRAVASVRASVSSATDSVETSGVYPTLMPLNDVTRQSPNILSDVQIPLSAFVDVDVVESGGHSANDSQIGG